MSSRGLSLLCSSVGVLSLAFAVGACGEDNKNTSAVCYDPLSTSCNQGGGGEGGGAPVQPASFFEGTYKADPVDYAWAFQQEFTNVATLANAFDWAGVEAAVAPTTLIGQQLEARAAEFCVGAEAKLRCPTALVAKGIAMGKMSGGDATKNDVALQYVEKSLIVLTQLYTMHEIAEAIEATDATTAVHEIDAAAIILAGLEGRMIKRQASEIPELWGAGSTLITQDKLAMHTGELLFAARTKVADGAADASAALIKANVYATKYFYASTLNYGYKVEAAVMGATETEVVQTEGAVFAEGLLLGFLGTNDTAAATMRGIWVGPASGVTIAALRPAIIGVYDQITMDAANYYHLPEQPTVEGMVESAGRIAGSIEVLTEALQASGADVAALQGQVTKLIDLSMANDIAGADAIAKELSAAVTAAVK